MTVPPHPQEVPANLAKGCVLCYQGAKMVLFVTGRCRRSCWYCPLSEERKGKDVIFANEHRVTSPEQAIAVAERMSALGTGITGGEPLLCLDRVVEFGKALKEHFGPEHQIHLYTAQAPAREDLARLRGVVDEIRLHPPRECWDHIPDTEFISSARAAKEMGFDIGIEVPALPGLDLLVPALPYLDFLNINELEWGETNADEMRERGYEPADGVHNAIAGARDWAEEIVRHEKVHWCASSFKDSVQLRERLRRIAENTARPFDEVTDDGTIVYGVLELHPGTRDEVVARCRKFLAGDEFADCGDRVETAWWLLEEYKEKIPGKKSVVERYPDGGMVVEVTPL
ncbi:radical SAM protein [Methanoregula sp.]|uniref:radical SAM protein n=1 Tax=Methanoregula sp. TaxID=2052170 RepID=UPI002BBB5ED9|nr:radical SAM protein [Methanoregula sp.]HVP97069.1 radical SAM protein [Methanoregula sp.]